MKKLNHNKYLRVKKRSHTRRGHRRRCPESLRWYDLTSVSVCCKENHVIHTAKLICYFLPLSAAPGCKFRACVKSKVRVEVVIESGVGFLVDSSRVLVRDVGRCILLSFGHTVLTVSLDSFSPAKLTTSWSRFVISATLRVLHFFHIGAIWPDTDKVITCKTL